jgi:hypothetical protein
VFEELRYGGGFKQIVAGVLIFALAAYWAFASSGVFSSGQTAKGVVLSAGPVTVAKVCGANQQVASVQLSKGRVVQALVPSSRQLQPGTLVTVRQQSFTCNPTHYEIVFSGK